MTLDWLPPELRAALTALSEVQRVGLILYGEARSEPISGLVAVGNVIRNRVKADLHGDGKPDWWGEGYSAVVTKPWQFSCLHPNGGRANYKRVLAFAEKLAAGTPITSARERQCIWVAHGIVGDYALDVVPEGANHYHTAALVPRPSWARDVAPVAQVARHVFYRLAA